MRVWRIAHDSVINADSGQPAGPYHTAAFYGDSNNTVDMAIDLCIAHSDDDHPSPSRDIWLNTIHANELCGLDSFESLVEWFGEHFLNRLRGHGFMIYEYESDAVRIGQVGGQVVFRKTTAKLIRKYEITTCTP